MGILATVENLDNVDDSLKTYYVEDGDGFKLDIEGVDNHPAVRGVVTANKSNRAARDKLRAEKEALEARFDGLPEDFNLDAYNTLKEAAEAKEGRPDEEVIRARLEAQAKAYEAKMAAAVDPLKSENEKYKASIHKMTIHQGLADALDQASIDPSFKDAAQALLLSKAKIELEESDGVFKASVDTDLGPQSLDEFVKGWASTDDGKRFVAKPTGPYPKPGGAAGGSKTITMNEFQALSHSDRKKVALEGVKVVD